MLCIVRVGCVITFLILQQRKEQIAIISYLDPIDREHGAN